MIALTIVQTTTGQVTLLPPHPGVTEKNVIAGVGVGASAGGGGRKAVAEARGMVVAGETGVIVGGGVESITQDHLHLHIVARVMILLLFKRRRKQRKGVQSTTEILSYHPPGHLPPTFMEISPQKVTQMVPIVALLNLPK